MKRNLFLFFTTLLCLMSIGTKAQVAKIGDTEYATLQAAIDAYQEGDVITVLEKQTTASVLGSGKTVKIFWNGTTVKAPTTEGAYYVAFTNETVDGNKIYTYTSTAAGASIIKTDGTIIYKSNLSGALSAATTGSTVTLLKDETSSTRINYGTTVIKNRTITIDLNGHTYTNTCTDASYHSFAIAYGNNVTVKNGTMNLADGIIIDASTLTIDTDATIVNNSESMSTSGVIVAKGSTLTVNGTLTSKGGTAITTNGSDTGANTVTINEGATVNCDHMAVYFPSKGTVTVNGTVSGYSGIEMKAGTLSVGATASITATGTKQHEVSTSGTSTSGYAVAVVENSGYQGPVTATIAEGATLNGGLIKAIDNEVAEEKKATITANGLVAVIEGENENVYYATLAAAVAAATDGQTITLLADVEENIVVETGKNIVLDLNGKTLNGKQTANTHTILNKGTLEVKNGTVKREGEGSSSYYIIENQGTLTLNATVTGSANASLIRNNAASAVMNITAGTYTQTGAFVVLKNDLGTVNVSGGTFTTQADKAVLNNWYTMNISGGTFNGQILNGAWDTEGNTLTITDGTFNSSKIRTYLGNGKTEAAIAISGGNFTNNAMTFTAEGTATSNQASITGGTFAVDPEAQVAEGYEATQSGDVWTVAEDPTVAKIGDTKYTTAKAAVTAAQDGETVVIVKQTTEKLGTISKSITIDYTNGSFTSVFAGSNYFKEDNGSVVTIRPRTEADAGSQASIYDGEELVAVYNNLQNAINAAEGKTVKVLTDLTCQGYGYTIGRNITLDLNGKTIQSTVRALYVDCNNATITGNGTVIGDYKNASSTVAKNYPAVEVYNGNLTIENGTYTVGGVNGSGNSTIFVSGDDAAVTIEGGSFSNGATYDGKYWVLNIKDGKTGTISVTGGSFTNFNPSNNTSEGEGTKFVAKGYGVVVNNNVYTVEKAQDTEVSDELTVNGVAASETQMEAIEEVVNNNTNVAEAVNEVAEKVVASAIPENAVESYIKVELTKAATEVSGENTVVTSMTFDVKPVYVTINEAEEKEETQIGNDKIATGGITFRLPVDKNVTKEAAEVFHEGTSIGYKMIQGDAVNGKYIEITANTYSEYSYVLTDETFGITAYYWDGEAKTKNMLTTEWADFQTQYPNAIAFTKTTQGAAFATAKTGDVYNNSNVVVESTDNLGNKTYACPNFVLTDKKDFYYPTDFLAMNVTYSRTNTGGYNSVCLPFSFTSSDVNGGEIQIFSNYNETQNEVHLQTVSVIDPGVPCFVKCADSDAGWNMSLTDKTIKASASTSSNLSGNYCKITIGADHYKLNASGTKFGKTTAAATSVAFRAYLDIVKDGGIGVESPEFLNVVIEDDLTSINGIETTKSNNGKYYNLNGQVIENPVKGQIYIYNGKKIRY